MPETEESSWGCSIPTILFLLSVYGIAIHGCNLDEHFDWVIDAPVKRCYQAIEGRDWNEYRSAFEPSAVMKQIPPGQPMQFLNPRTTVLHKGVSSATIQFQTQIKWEGLDSKLPLDVQINLVKVKNSGISGSIGLKRWYIVSDQEEILPFDGWAH
jgi:hypothetical protein